MPMGVKMMGFTDKSSLLASIRRYKEKGLKITEIAVNTGYSVSYIKKLSAQAGRRKTKVQIALDQLKKNPYLDISSLELTDSQKDMLYRSDIWQSEIKPYRILYDVRNNYQLKVNSQYLNAIHPKTRESLEQLQEWSMVLNARKEFDEFRKQLRKRRPELKAIEHTTTMATPYAGIVNLEELRQIRDRIPKDQQYALSGEISIMHDFKYVQVCQDIHLLESKVLKAKVKVIEKLYAPLSDEAKRMVNRYFKIPIYKQTILISDGVWHDIAALLNSFNEDFTPSYSNTVQNDWYNREEMLEKENRNFVAS